MRENWIVVESRKADGTRDYVILENPQTRRRLDDLLLNRFWPVIHDCLEQTGYDYHPQESPQPEFTRGLSSATRSIPSGG